MTAGAGAAEQALMSSGMAYTILPASYFMEVWLTPALGFDVAHGTARIYGDGTRPVSWVSFRDVAKVAAAAVTERAARNQVVELGGPEALSPREVVRMFEAAGAGEIATESVPEAAVARRFAPFTLHCFSQPLDAPTRAAHGLTRCYIASVKPDYPVKPVFDPFAQRARDEGWSYHELPTGHDAQAEMPDALAALLVAAST